MKGSAPEFARALARSQGWRLWRTLALMLAVPMVEGIGLALMLPTLQAAGMDLHGQGRADRLARAALGALDAIGFRPGFFGLLAVYVGVAAARAMLARKRGVAMWATQQNFADEERRRLYAAIVGARWRFLARSHLADFLHALTAEIDRVGYAVSNALSLAGELALNAIYLAAALALAPAMTAIALAAAAALAVSLNARTRRIRAHGEELTRATNLLYAAASEHLQSLKTARAFGAEARNRDLFGRLSGGIARLYVGVEREQVAANSWFELSAAAMLLPILYVAMRVLHVPPAALLMLLLIFMRVMPRAQSGHLDYRNLVSLLPSFANLRELEARCAAAAEPLQDASAPPPLKSEIRLEAVVIAYSPGGAPALDGFNLAIPAGKITALAGPSGAGKSTVADLVMGLMAPDAGRITIDGAPLTETNAAAWRRQLGYVGAETALFNLSVRENLLWAAPEAAEADLWAALERAAAADFVRALPHGIDTIVGERGALLAAGERQRIAIARALLRRPAVLILDEATNHLDYENEARVLDAIAAAAGSVTTLMIAHRMSALRRADLICVIENGRTVESGGWEELNGRANGRFRTLRETHRLVA